MKQSSLKITWVYPVACLCLNISMLALLVDIVCLHHPLGVVWVGVATAIVTFFSVCLAVFVCLSWYVVLVCQNSLESTTQLHTLMVNWWCGGYQGRHGRFVCRGCVIVVIVIVVVAVVTAMVVVVLVILLVVFADLIVPVVPPGGPHAPCGPHGPGGPLWSP